MISPSIWRIVWEPGFWFVASKACSVFKPDYCVVHFEDSPWIHQPFECYDDLGIENHIARCREKFGDNI